MTHSWTAVLAVLCLSSATVQDGRLRSRHWTWDGPFRHGVCGADSVRVELRPDGTGTQQSVTWTTNARSGQYWWWRLEALDSERQPLWTSSWRRGPRMTDGGAAHTVPFVYDFTFPANRYPRAVYLHLGFRCQTTPPTGYP